MTFSSSTGCCCAAQTFFIFIPSGRAWWGCTCSATTRNRLSCTLPSIFPPASLVSSDLIPVNVNPALYHLSSRLRRGGVDLRDALKDGERKIREIRSLRRADFWMRRMRGVESQVRRITRTGEERAGICALLCVMERGYFAAARARYSDGVRPKRFLKARRK